MGASGGVNRGIQRIARALAALTAAAVAIPAGAAPNQRLDYLGFLQQGDDGLIGLDAAYSSIVSADGKFLYATATAFNWVSVYAIDPATRLVSQIQKIKANRDDDPVGEEAFTAPIDGLLSPDGKFLYVPAYFGQTLFVYSRDETTGLITEVQQGRSPAVGQVGYLSQTSDGLFMFAPGYDTNTISTLSRNPVTGFLGIVETVNQGGVPVADALNTPAFCAVSPDQKFLYVANDLGNSVSWFSIDPTTRLLTYQGVVRDGDPGVNNLRDARWIAISEDSRFLYVTGLLDNAINVFERNTTTGALAIRQSIRDDVRLEAARCTILSPDNSILMVNGYFGNTTIQFHRDAGTGLLSELAAYQNDYQPGALGLVETRDISFSPDGTHVYFASWGNMGIGTYKLNSYLVSTDTWRLY